MNDTRLEDLIDIGLLCIVLVLFCSYAFTKIYTLNHDISYYESEIQDKNTGSVKGEYVSGSGSYDETLSATAVVLVSQIQDKNMPFPQKIMSDGSELFLPMDKKDEAYGFGQMSWLLIPGTPSDRYKVDFNRTFGPDGHVTDSSYVLEKVIP